MEARSGSELVRSEIEVAGVRRSFWLARAPRQGGRAAPPLLVALHGPGLDGQAMAFLTGLAGRGPAAGITVVFPDSWKGGWQPARPRANRVVPDDARFLTELAVHLEGIGAARSWPVFLTGIGPGARYADYIARNGLLPVAGLFLVGGTALESSRHQVPVPQLRASMTLVIGTDDKTAPYEGGQLARTGISRLTRRPRTERRSERPGENITAGAEAVVADWAAANGIIGTGINSRRLAGNRIPGGGVAGGGIPDGGVAGGGIPVNRVAGTGITAGGSGPVVDELPVAPGSLPVTRKTWTRPGCHPATLYRINGGGYGWPGVPGVPGGPQLTRARGAGAVPRQLDATGLLLTMAERETAIASGHYALDQSEIA
ncbi:MAG TPA: hypothetical protein VGD91_12370 [Trebonia sp.]